MSTSTGALQTDTWWFLISTIMVVAMVVKYMDFAWKNDTGIRLGTRAKKPCSVNEIAQGYGEHLFYTVGKILTQGNDSNGHLCKMFPE